MSPGVKRSGREAYHSPPTSAEVKNTWIYTSTHSVMNRDNFAFTLPVNLGKESRSLDRGLNPGLLEYDTGVRHEIHGTVPFP
jgi:hypothetical protein